MTSSRRPVGRRAVGYVVLWLAAAAAAVAVGVFAVSGVGASVRDRGPIGEDTEAVRRAGLTEGSAVPDPDARAVRETFSGEYGSLATECRGSVAYGIDTDPAPGWTIVSFETGPDDDVDAVFSRGDRSVELDIFCNLGEPTIGDREVKTLPADPDE